LQRRALLSWTLTWILAAALFMGVALHAPNNLDVDWYLLAARTLSSHGGELYETLRDPNPPAVWQLFMANDALARWTGWPAHRLYYVLTAVFCLAMLAWTAVMLPARFRRATVLGGGLLLGFAAVDEAGQRDLLAAAAFLPYLAWIQRLSQGEAANRSTGYAATLLAALALLLKPYFLLYFVVLECLLAWRAGRWRTWLRPDLLLPAAAALLLGALQLAAHPAYLAYLGDYGAFYATWPPATLSSRAFLALLALLGLLFWLFWQRRWASWAATLAAAGLAAALTATVQNKWWDYHAYPIMLFAGLGWIAALAAPWPRLAGWKSLLSSVLVSAIAVWLTGEALRGAELNLRHSRWDPGLAADGLLAREIDRLAPGERIGILGGHTGAIAAYLSHASWGLADPPFWVVLQVAERRLQGQALRPVEAAAEARHLAELVERLRSAPPALLAFWRSPGYAPLDALAYYRLDPSLAAILDERYAPAGEVANYSLYLLRR
jgi:hypothetical protein